jgi:hypothetical protein
MFANDTKMQVTQESDGKIRMTETDVPKDLLEIKIHHLSFPANYRGPAMATVAILRSPEVMDFMERNIGRKTPWEGWGLPGQISVDGPSVSGELNDVTVAQALDYILQTFPGFWTYQNCYDSEGRRRVSVGFHENIEVVGASIQETK